MPDCVFISLAPTFSLTFMLCIHICILQLFQDRLYLLPSVPKESLNQGWSNFRSFKNCWLQKSLCWGNVCQHDQHWLLDQPDHCWTPWSNHCFEKDIFDTYSPRQYMQFEIRKIKAMPKETDTFLVRRDITKDRQSLTGIRSYLIEVCCT